eukprot:4538459-Pyramimonas_sp.AAC.1
MLSKPGAHNSRMIASFLRQRRWNFRAHYLFGCYRTRRSRLQQPTTTRALVIAETHAATAQMLPCLRDPSLRRRLCAPCD